MTDKYYIPSIEEFYRGFEFEAHISADLIQGQTKEWQTTTVQIGDIFFIHDNLPIEKIFRVKYLDNEDIESCGWIKDENGRYTKGYSEIIFVGDLNHPNKYRINFCGNCYFCGYIKNKSELIRVMKMLGI